ncbi:ribonuclease HII [Strigomonas culicis]|uniref:Ribonuclease n=1 Tax=Strigomonas culicis TaxID=28005 RepID=S9USY2_9TRYP|nr:ribonuclease HII [Strigomonas culicis]|eukprot:EPY31924.1 ribonuclease HII [Strigomonas culicis]
MVGFASILVDAATVDAVNILNATLEGMAAAAAKLVEALRRAGVPLSARNTCILIDGNRVPWCFLQEEQKRKKLANPKTVKSRGKEHAALRNVVCQCVVKGDQRVASIATASIVAKVTRDEYASAVMHRQCPQYGFDEHKGYCVARHTELLRQLGPCAFHRRTFAPVRAVLGSAKQRRMEKRKCT